jgi:hypothetical protein
LLGVDTHWNPISCIYAVWRDPCLSILQRSPFCAKKHVTKGAISGVASVNPM